MVHMAAEGIHSALNRQIKGAQRRPGDGGEARRAYRTITGVVMRRKRLCMPKGISVQPLTSHLRNVAAVWEALSMKTVNMRQRGCFGAFRMCMMYQWNEEGGVLRGLMTCLSSQFCHRAAHALCRPWS